MTYNRCTGCRYRMPQRLGGYGVLCLQDNGKCPNWVVNSALEHGLQPLVDTGKLTDKVRAEWDEKLLEILRM